MRNVLVKIVVEKENTFNVRCFFPENLSICERMWKNGQGTDDNISHAHCMLDTQGYTHTHTHTHTQNTCYIRAKC